MHIFTYVYIHICIYIICTIRQPYLLNTCHIVEYTLCLFCNLNQNIARHGYICTHIFELGCIYAYLFPCFNLYLSLSAYNYT